MSAWSIQVALAALLKHHAKPVPLRFPTWFKEASQVASMAYRKLVHAPGFTQFFAQATPLDVLEFSRMGSRPTRRTGTNTLTDLRAIPFALCQSQSRMNITAWYGIGKMLQYLKEVHPKQFHHFSEHLQEYPQVAFVLTNVEMAIKSASMEWATAYAHLVSDSRISEPIIQQIQAEYTVAVQMLTEVFKQPFEVRRPRLALTVAKRKVMLDVLHDRQLAWLSAWRKDAAQQTKKSESELMATLMTINAISNGLRGTG